MANTVSPCGYAWTRPGFTTLIRSELHNKGINLPYSYEVTLANKDSLIFSKASDITGEKPTFDADTYQTQIFSKDVINDPGLD